MPRSWERSLARWSEAGLLDADVAARIRAWESRRQGGSLRWPAWLALGLGGMLLAAGVLLFVAAHWDAMPPGQRFGLVLFTIFAFHLAGAGVATQAPGLALTLHACGTVALGGGIYLAAQIFHLEEHWPRGLLLWSAGAWIGWALRRDWAQAGVAALVTPAWLGAEWLAATEGRAGAPVLAIGLMGLTLAYLGAEPSRHGGSAGVRRTLVWLGGLAAIPVALLLVMTGHEWRRGWDLPAGLRALGWSIALGIPIATGWALRGRQAAPLVAGVGWAALGPVLAARGGVAPYLWCAGLAVGLIGWGLLERRAERVNLGVAGFALTVGVFYFSDVMGRLGRSVSLIGLGLLFLGGGYLLERARRRLLAGLRVEA